MPRPFSEFVKERKYLHNVSPATLAWYESSWKAWEKYQPDFVVNAREAGVSPATVNCYLRCLNAYFRWAGLPVIRRLKTEQRVLAVFSESQINRIIQFRQRGRVPILCLLLLDTGLRINEALTLTWADVNFDNLIVRVKGKGGKERLVPFSYELRKILWKWKPVNALNFALVLPAKSNRKLMHRNVLRDVKNFCRRLGFEPPARTLHAFRHSFALNFLRGGGSVFHLQRILGHSTLDMTRRYVSLTTDDLQEAQQRVSLLNRMR